MILVWCLLTWSMVGTSGFETRTSTIYFLNYFVNKPLLAARMLTEKWIFGRQAKPQGKTWNFEDNLPAKDIISQDTPQNQKGGHLFYNPPINFHLARKPLVKGSVFIAFKTRILILVISNDFIFLPRKIREMERNAFQARNRERATKNGILGPK